MIPTRPIQVALETQLKKKSITLAALTRHGQLDRNQGARPLIGHPATNPGSILGAPNPSMRRSVADVVDEDSRCANAVHG